MKRLLYSCAKLDANAYISRKALSQRTGLMEAALSKRISRLRDSGVIKKFTLEVDYVRAGFGVSAFLFLRVKKLDRDMQVQIEKLSSVVEVYQLLGKHDYCLRRICDSKYHLDGFLDRRYSFNRGGDGCRNPYHWC